MKHLSARELVGLPVVDISNGENLYGTVETVLIDPAKMTVSGFYLRQDDRADIFLEIDCVTVISADGLHARVTKDQPAGAQRLIGLPALTIKPAMLVGFVFDFSFDRDDNHVKTLIIHQLIRRWEVPVSAVVKITPRSLLIDNDTTAKLKITPFPSTKPA